jgi:glycosyltransferase involved in cell wall biosynthesis
VIVAVSKPVAGSLEDLGLPAGSIRIVHNSVRSEYLDPLPDREDARAELGLPDDLPVIAMAGRLVPYKGHAIFLEALSLLSRRGIQVVGVIVGSSPIYEVNGVDPFPGYEDELRGRAAQPDLWGRVVFLGQQLTLRPLLAATDVFVVPSINEPFPLVVLEGMATGVAVVASDSGGHPEAIEDGISGRLFTSGNPEALAHILAELLTDDESRSRLGRNGRCRVEEKFLQARFCDDISTLISSALPPAA